MQFKAGDGKQKMLRPGKTTQRQAGEIKGCIEQLSLAVGGVSGYMTGLLT